MYFSGELSVDPSQCTKIVRNKPEKAFSKFLHFATLGAVTDKEEYETFTAVSILQQVNRALRGMGITNVVRLAKDDIDFYLDKAGKKDDMKEAMEKFEVETDSLESKIFNNLKLVVEHQDCSFKYYVDIGIKRVHKFREHPITITINALNAEFCVAGRLFQKERETTQKMRKHFITQQAYNEFLASKQLIFEEFLNNIELGLKRFIVTDKINRKIYKKIIRTDKKINKQRSIQRNHHSDPVFYGYYGCDEYLYYSYLWSDMCHSHNIYCNDIFIVDEQGADIMSIGERGFNAGENNTFNSAEDFEVPQGADKSTFDGSQYGEIQSASSETSSDTTPSWASLLGGGDSDSSGPACSSSGSSCSSCGSD